MKIETPADIPALAWEKMSGLIPCIVQDAWSAEVLMQGYMNEAALAQTLQSGAVTFYSRSKERLWTKGETSGHTLQFVSASADCDLDSILVLAKPQGPTCHLGNRTCWEQSEQSLLGELAHLTRTIQARAASQETDKSYTAKLLSEGVRRCSQKVGEEGVEVALAAVAQDDDALLNESADLLYHLLVVLEARNLSLADVTQVLRNRRKN
ncbi:MAG: bifunctional phosphoribosyl-ATP pyrophosphohydrolase / phosphoribosyl-AMP cyclohydrolase HisIE [Idiomarinaceae bacterium HL-53]|nr:MAG: bifunctional phosphoribosyl-ATP pyrophosphohydrolase / phosphoribosyl-AMP cyclohydrolase HisIE [Idiomarinaceae bacterium HL-53]CUS48577.1 phosphoribosyl-ATP pyrophosphatase /phosphoribosyl-AMP cyclohydrolase [Idiomarinaceae bacterium HL-53]